MKGLAPLVDPTLPQPQPMRPGHGIPTDIERVLGTLAVIAHRGPVKVMPPMPELFISLEIPESRVRETVMRVLKSRGPGNIEVKYEPNSRFMIGDERL